MKILCVSSYYPPHVGGLEIVVQNQARRLAARGHAVTVVTSSVTPHEESGVQEGVVVVRIKALNSFEKIGVPFPFFSPKIFPVLFRAVREADIVQVHDAFYFSSFVAVLFARWHRKPVVLMQHVELVNHPSLAVMAVQKIALATIGSFLFKVSDAILTLNDRVEEFLVARHVPKYKIFSVVNGVDTSIFYPATDREKRALRDRFGFEERPVVLFVGRFVPKKGFHKMIEARAHDYQIVFAGGKPPPKLYEGTIFAGSLPQEELADLYRAADLFVLPSESEGFPLSVQEAMATGLPIITTNDPGYARYGFDHEKIVMLNSPQSESIRRAIRSVLADSARRESMARYSLRYAQTHFDWEKIVGELELLYRQLLEKYPVKKVLVTTSWDDGHILDMKLAALLEKYDIPATFYISPRNREFPREELLNDEQIRALSRSFEIGAHTMTHPQLPRVSLAQARKEICNSKEYLEQLAGKPVRSFCYPRGRYTLEHVEQVRQAGYKLARTVERFASGRGEDSLQVPTSIHAYDHVSDIWNLLCFVRFNPIAFCYYYRRFDRQAIAFFERVTRRGGVFHLWGHSWEIEKFGNWKRLEDVLRHIGGRSGVRYITNGELV